MTDREVRQLAARFDVASNGIWRQQSYAPNVLTVKPGELDFVDVLLQGDEAVAVQRGNHVAFTTGMEFGTIRMLCHAAPISSRTLRDYDSDNGRQKE
jgi:hypothetical protein